MIQKYIVKKGSGLILLKDIFVVSYKLIWYRKYCLQFLQIFTHEISGGNVKKSAKKQLIHNKLDPICFALSLS